MNKKEDGACGVLLYADDIILLAVLPRELQRVLGIVREYVEKWRVTSIEGVSVLK